MPRVAAPPRTPPRGRKAWRRGAKTTQAALSLARLLGREELGAETRQTGARRPESTVKGEEKGRHTDRRLLLRIMAGALGGERDAQ